MSRPNMSRSARRRGGVYVILLVTIAFVAAALVASLDVVRSRYAEAELVEDSAQAWQSAESALEGAIHTMEDYPDWRWRFGDGAWVTDMAYGDAVVTVEATGADGSALSESAWQPVRLTAIARYGRARAILSADLGLQGEGFHNAGSILYANALVGYWPWCDGASGYLSDRVSGNTAEDRGSADSVRPEAVPGFGAAAAAWFSGDVEIRINRRDSYNAIRSISVWIMPDDVTSKACITARDAASYDDGSWQIFVWNGNLYGGFETDTSAMLTSTPIQAGRWHYVVLVAEWSRIVLYVDGVAADSDTVLNTPYWSYTDGKDIYVGRAAGSADDGVLAGSTGFTGAICELALMSDALTAQEVQDLYNAYPEPAAYKVLADSWNRAVR